MKPRTIAAEKKRNEAISKPGYRVRWEKARAARGENTKCPAGHDLSKIENAHVGDLKRTGKITCDPCNRKAQERYQESAGQPASAPKAKKQRATKPTAAPKPAPATVTLTTTGPVTASGWTAEEEKEIARLQETQGLSRKSALQRMRRAAKHAVKA